MSKMEESNPTHESLHSIRVVKIKVVEEVEEKTCRQTYLNKLENLIQAEYCGVQPTEYCGRLKRI